VEQYIIVFSSICIISFTAEINLTVLEVLSKSNFRFSSIGYDFAVLMSEYRLFTISYWLKSRRSILFPLKNLSNDAL